VGKKKKEEEQQEWNKNGVMGQVTTRVFLCVLSHPPKVKENMEETYTYTHTHISISIQEASESYITGGRR